MDARTRRQINRELFNLTHRNPDLGTGIGRTIEIMQKASLALQQILPLVGA